MKKRQSPSAQSHVAHMAHLLREPERQVVYGLDNLMRRNRPAQNKYGNPLQPSILDLFGGEGVGLRKRPLAEVTSLKRPCCTPKQYPLQSQCCYGLQAWFQSSLEKRKTWSHPLDSLNKPTVPLKTQDPWGIMMLCC